MLFEAVARCCGVYPLQPHRLVLAPRRKVAVDVVVQ